MSPRMMLVKTLRRTGLMSLIAFIHQQWLNLIKWFCRIRGKSHLEAIYNDAYFAAEEEWTQPTAKAVVDIILGHFSPKTLVDIGCGSAVYLKYFQAAGLSVKGYEGSAAAIQRAFVDRSLIEQCDLTRPLSGAKSYDLAICFEVAEHLPAQAADQLVESISTLSNTILFSAAQPGQGGVDHINEQPWNYWADKFVAQGFALDESTTETMRKAFGRQGSVWWLEKNLFVVRRK